MDSVNIKSVEVEATAVKEKADVQQLDSNLLHQAENKDLGESLQKHANLFVKSYGMGSMATVSMRGTNSSQTKIYWNDIQLNSALNGIVDLALFPTFFMDEAEVNYGLSSMKLGSGGLGGAIQLKNKANFSESNHIQLQQDIGSFGLYNSQLKISLGNHRLKSQTKLFRRQADNDFEYLNFNKANAPQEKVRNATLRQEGLMQSFYYRLKENQLLETHLWYYRSDRNLPPLMTSIEFKEHQEDDAIRLLIGYKKYLSKGQFSIKSALTNQSVFYENERTSTASLTQTANWYNVVGWKQRFGKKLFTNFRLNTAYNQINPGAEVNQIDRKQLSAFQLVDYEFTSKWKAEVQLREELILNEGSFFLPTAELTFKPKGTEDLSLYAKAGKNLKYPSLNDLYWQPGGNPNLQAEESITAEIGLQNELSIFDKSYTLNWQTALYVSSIDNYIQWQPTAFGYWQALNLKEVATQGVEVRAKLKSQKAKLKKELRLNYTYTSSVNKASNHAIDHSVDQQLIYIPEHQYNINFNLSRKGYSLNYNFQFMGARYTTSDNESFLPYYTLSDLSLGKAFKWKDQSLQLSFAVMNVFDTEYQAIEWRPMPNRNYLFTLKYKIQP
tara:strand:- start:2288 stop:4123 length:1836 start_codon:yes stop_codon:yes gene_type:complete